MLFGKVGSKKYRFNINKKAVEVSLLSGKAGSNERALLFESIFSCGKCMLKSKAAKCFNKKIYPGSFS